MMKLCWDGSCANFLLQKMSHRHFLLLQKNVTQSFTFASHFTMMHVSFVSIVVFYAVLLLPATGAQAVSYCSCRYNVPFEDEVECRSYGQLGDDVLIPWYRANQTCLDTYQIKVSAIDSEILFDICPYENATDADVQVLLNEIRYNPSAATRAIQASFPTFWMESNTTVGSYELVDVIYDGRNNPNCIVSETLCYNTIREYFTTQPSELGSACKEFHARHRFEKDEEQSIVRIRLCQEVDSTNSTDLSNCEPLVSQIITIKNSNPSKACSAFGLGPGTQQDFPTCSGNNATNVTSSTRGTRASYQSMGWYGFYHTLLVLIAITVTCFY